MTGVVSCDTCHFKAPTAALKPFDPCPKCQEPCSHDRLGDGKMRLLFHYPSGAPVIHEEARPNE